MLTKNEVLDKIRSEYSEKSFIFDDLKKHNYAWILSTPLMSDTEKFFIESGMIITEILGNLTKYSLTKEQIKGS